MALSPLILWMTTLLSSAMVCMAMVTWTSMLLVAKRPIAVQRAFPFQSQRKSIWRAVPRNSQRTSKKPPHFVLPLMPCHDIVGSWVDKGITHMTHHFTDASSKSDSWLLKKKKVLLKTTMNMIPQTRAALNAGKIAKATLDTLCENGLRDFRTKGKGWTPLVSRITASLMTVPLQQEWQTVWLIYLWTISRT